jgi:uncharacterized protein YggT (Ycf19 family)
MPSASSLSYWYFQGPSLLLAAFVYLLVARLALWPLVGAGTPVMRVLAALTNPVVKAVSAITPRVVPSALVVVFAIMWLLSARILLHQVFLARRMFGFS